MVVLGRRFGSNLIRAQIELEVQVREHLPVLELGLGPELLNVGLVLQRYLQLLQDLVDTGLVLGLPLDLPGLFLCDGLVKRAGKVVRVDHLSQVTDDFLLQRISRTAHN